MKILISDSNLEHKVQSKRVLDFFETLKKENFGSQCEKVLELGVVALESTTVSNTVIESKSYAEKLVAEMNREIQSALTEFKSALSRESNPSIEGTSAAVFLKTMKEISERLEKNTDPNNPSGVSATVVAEIRKMSEELKIQKSVNSALMSKSMLKGRDYEESVQSAVEEITSHTSDVCMPTGDKAAVGASKKGDILLCTNNGKKVSIEVKRTKIHLTPNFLENEVRAGMVNRGASAGILVVHPEYASSVGSPVKILQNNIIACVYDPEGDLTPLSIAIQVAKFMTVDSNQTEDKFDKEKLFSLISSKMDEIASIERTLGQSVNGIEKARAELSVIRKRILRECESSVLEAPANDEKEDEKTEGKAAITDEGKRPAETSPWDF